MNSIVSSMMDKLTVSGPIGSRWGLDGSLFPEQQGFPFGACGNGSLDENKSAESPGRSISNNLLGFQNCPIEASNLLLYPEREYKGKIVGAQEARRFLMKRRASPVLRAISIAKSGEKLLVFLFLGEHPILECFAVRFGDDLFLPLKCFFPKGGKQLLRFLNRFRRSGLLLFETV